MKQDKALKKTLSKFKTGGLSYGFDQRVMNAIFVEADKKKKRSSILSLGLVSLVSLVIIGGAIYLINAYTSFSFSLTFPRMQFSEETRNILLFSFYIAALVLVLLGFDTFFRRLKQNQGK